MASKCFVLIFSFILFQNVYSFKDLITEERENVLRKLINSSVDPCVDFYKFACGNYEKLYPIPDYYGKFENLDRITEDNYIVLDRLLQENIDDILKTEPSTAEEKAKVFYSMCNNIDEINKQGNEALLQLLTTLSSYAEAEEKGFPNPFYNKFTLIESVHSILYRNPFFTERYILREPTKVTNRLIPGFFSLRTPIGKSNIEKEKIRSILKEIGLNETAANNSFDEYYKFYEKISELNSSQKPTRKTATISEFEKLISGLNWKQFLNGVYNGVFKETDFIYVDNVEYFKNLTKLIQNTKGSEISSFALVNLIDGLLPVLGSGFLKIQDRFNEAKQGYKKSMPRWRQCIDLVVEVFNLPTAALFMKRTNLPDNRHNVQQMLDNLKSVFTQFLQNSAWPGSHTKNKSFEKLNALQFNLNWENIINETAKINQQYYDVFIDPSSFFNTYVFSKMSVNYQIGNLYVEQSKDIWMYPLISAKSFAMPQVNSFSIHPGLIQPSFFYSNFPKFLQFAGLGVTISHEMFHSYDSIGASYNAQGLLDIWWNSGDYEDFQNRTKCFISQYDNFTLYGKSLKARPRDFENIADFSAIKFAYIAYDNFLKENHQAKDETVEGLSLTSRQLFFVSMAQQFCSQVRPEAVEYFIKTADPAIGPYRVIGIVQNSEEFSREFQCPAGSPMNPNKKCNIYS